jgi:hypothetical protein
MKLDAESTGALAAYLIVGGLMTTVWLIHRRVTR